MPVIEHIEGTSFCRHNGKDWNEAALKVVKCTGKPASLNDLIEIVRGMQNGKGVWHGGILLTPGRRS